MKRTKVYAVMIVVGSLVVTWVAADFETSQTPLYTFRMEQQSSKMGFLPTKITEFTYTTYGQQNCSILGNGGEIPYSTTEVTCTPTCEITCPITCWGTCCLTCPDTCEHTCWETCGQTCPDTCEHTCRYTCDKPCQP